MAHASYSADNLDEAVRSACEAVDTIVGFGGSYRNTCPPQNYFGSGPLTREEVQQCANLPNHRELIKSTDPRYVH